jgi:hypothetical protein
VITWLQGLAGEALSVVEPRPLTAGVVGWIVVGCLPLVLLVVFGGGPRR